MRKKLEKENKRERVVELRINKAILMHLIEAVWEFEFMKMQILLLYIVEYWKTLETI